MDITKIARYLIHYFIRVGEPLTNLKLQKLLYYIEVWHLVYFDGESLFKEKPQAWVHGPVYPTIYHKYKHYQSQPIIFKDLVDDEDLDYKLGEAVNFDDNKKDFINSILKFYGTKSAFELEMLTHNENPWIEARKGYQPLESSTKEIDLVKAKEYYASLIGK
jgi:uncharacterized phage-associated protein